MEEQFETFEGTYAEAKAKVFSLNYSRRQLSAKEQRDVIRGEIAEVIGPPSPGGYAERQLEEIVEREIARIVGCSHNTVGSVIDELRDPPELKKYRQWLKTWKKELPEDQRMMFIHDQGRELVSMLRDAGGLVNVTS